MTQRGNTAAARTLPSALLPCRALTAAVACTLLQASKDLPAVQAMLAKAEEVLGYDLLALCSEGPKEKLDDTIYSQASRDPCTGGAGRGLFMGRRSVGKGTRHRASASAGNFCARSGAPLFLGITWGQRRHSPVPSPPQPALFVAGLAAVEKVRAENPTAVDSAASTAGLSLGEYTALVFSGALSFEDGLRVVKVRASSMAAAARAGRPHGMLSVIGLSDPDLERVVESVNAKLPDSVCRVANYLFPQGRVVSGGRVCGCVWGRNKGPGAAACPPQRPACLRPEQIGVWMG